ncbi:MULTISPECIES: hypothetical protein [unclassified Brevundimonas]|uniref:hypothetical protein n=1 Tax=unclassified Brevundimonas TaxID=2622653 RepID=UPI003B589387
MSTPSRTGRRIAGPKTFLMVMGLSLAAGAIAGVGNAVAAEFSGAAAFAVSIGLNAVAMAVCLLLAIWWWRRLDEAAREAHKWAWWWGGCSGMAVGGVLLLTLQTQEVDIGLSGMPPGEVLAFGMAVMLGFLLVGYAIGWVVWWAQRR